MGILGDDGVKRDEVLSLLKELMDVCESMRFSPVVSLMPCPHVGRWKLSVKWDDSAEKGCFDKIVNERGLMATITEDGYTIFQKPQC
jgi:hypothetical protein